MSLPTLDEFVLAGLPHAGRAYAQAWTVGGTMCLAWGVAVPALLFGRSWSVSGVFGLGAILATGTSLLVLAGFLRRRRVWAAHALWAIALAALLTVVVLTFAWGAAPNPTGLIFMAVVATSFGVLGWRAWLAVTELQRAAGEDARGFEPILPALPAARQAPGEAPPPPEGPADSPQPPSDSVRGK